MQIKQIPISRLNPAAYNPRKDLKPEDKEYKKLRRSIEEFGIVEPIVWNERTGNVVGGHQRLKVLRDIGNTEIDCVIVDIDEQREKALNVALNKIQGEWDEDKLAALFSDLEAEAFDVTLTGFDMSEVDELLNQFYATEAVEDEFDEETAREEIKAKGTNTALGDIWQLGEHRLLCGNPADAEAYTKLLGGERAQLAVTHPPGISAKDYEKSGAEAWLNEMRAVIKSLTKYADTVCWTAADKADTKSQYIEPLALYSVNLFADGGYRPIWMRVWKKTNKGIKAAPYHLVTNKPVADYEYITAYANNGEIECDEQEFVFVSAFAGHAYKFVKRLTKDERKRFGYSGIWEIAAGSSAPVELPWRCIKMHSDRGGGVLDPFCGTGTTLIACEQTGRRCFAICQDETEADLTVKRWEEFTGQKAVKQ